MSKNVTPSQNRRDVLKASATGALLAAVGTQSSFANRAQRRLRVGVMGLSRGRAHIDSFANCEDVEIAYVCDVDRTRLDSGAKRSADRQGKAAESVTDFRHMLDDKSLDAISIAAPNFWHAPATLLALSAGKHVYVEKPGSHSMFESQLMVEANKKYKRCVQLGVQRRSMPHYIDAIQKMRNGEIGKLLYARCWYDSERGGIGNGKPAVIPEWLNYELWQGPAPRQPFKDNLIHYNWHWHWTWGNGELGNNGIHALDVARWGLNVDFPKQVSYLGGRYHYHDDQETPDTGYAVYDFGSCGASWEQSSCNARREEKHSFVTFYGDKYNLAINDQGYKVFERSGKEVSSHSGGSSQQPHFQNFVDGIRDGAPLNADIADTQKSTQLCHLGNISQRTGRIVTVEVENGQVKHSKETSEYWQRAYEPGWKPTM